MRILASTVVIASTLLAACSSEGNSNSATAGDDGILPAGEPLMDVAMEPEADAGAPSDSSTAWSACVADFAPLPGTVSDTFEVLVDEGFSTAEEPTSDGFIVRMTKNDPLTRSSHEFSFEFLDTNSPPTGSRCGPRVVRIGRGTVNGQVAPVYQARHFLAARFSKSRVFLEHRKSPQQGAQATNPDDATDPFVADEEAISGAFNAQAGVQEAK